MTTLIAHKLESIDIKKIALALVMVVIFLTMASNTFRPIRVFVSYYTCKVLSYSNLVELNCNTLPTIAVILPKLTDANQLGAEDPMALALFFENHEIDPHIYAHRTNSPDRANIYKKYYSSFEFDAIWDANRSVIDIFHWPERKSISFLFSDLLDIIGNEKYYWMDLKNLNSSNYLDIINHIHTLTGEDTKLNKKHLIIESKNVEILSRLSQEEFLTSYYLPDTTPNTSCNDLSSTTLKIVNNIQKYSTRYISFPYQQQAYVDQCLLPIIGDIEQLSWGGLPFAIPKGASERYRAYIVDHSMQTLSH